MKFEANIPSYLRTGQGVFPVKERSAPKPVDSGNFYEMAKQGFNIPVANETNTPAFAPVGDMKPRAKYSDNIPGNTLYTLCTFIPNIDI